MSASDSASMRRSAILSEAEQSALGEAHSTSQPSERGSTRNSIGIIFRQVEKRFGSLVALRNISLEVQPGEFVALLGANGAGKTTLLRMAAQLVKPTSGSIELAGNGSASSDARRFFGFVGHSTLLYDELSASENLELFAKLYGLQDVDARVSKALEACGLASRASSLVREFSRGMRQRMAIARALLHGPQMLLLDEPAAGLDRLGIAWLGTTLTELRGHGCTILMSTHARNESIELATRAVVIAGGVIARDSGLGGDLAPLLAELRSSQNAEG